VSPYFAALPAVAVAWRTAQTAAFGASFVVTISLFLVFADLFPKRLGMNDPEQLAARTVGPMQALIDIVARWCGCSANATDGLFRCSACRCSATTGHLGRHPGDDGGRRAAGVLARREQQVIANVFELHTRTVSSAMTPRDRIAWFRATRRTPVIRARIAAEPFSAYPVCDGVIDHVLGYVDAKDLFQRVLNGEPIPLADEAAAAQGTDRARPADAGRGAGAVPPGPRRLRRDRQRVQPGGGRGHAERRDEHRDGRLCRRRRRRADRARDENSWLIDGVTPITDVLRALRSKRCPTATSTKPWPAS
jgi:hypothetical protein